MKPVAVLVCLIVLVAASAARTAHFLSDEYINSINDQQDQWEAGQNFDPDTSPSEFKQLLGAKMEGRQKLRRGYVKHSDPLWPDTKKIPKKFDARRKWGKKCPSVKQVLDQGKCGSCWAIAATQAFTDRYCIATKGKHKARLSTASVLSCCSECGDGCEGGWEYHAWTYFIEHGLPSGGNFNTSVGCYPYNIQSPCNYNDKSPYPRCTEVNETPTCETTCPNEKYSKTMTKDYRFAKNRYALPKNEEAIMKEIMTHGPVTAAFEVFEDFPNYKSGVYEPSNQSLPMGGHAIKLIGWGVEKGVPYWLVMNSWNDYWGDHGLVKMKRNSPMIELESEAWAAEADPKRKF